MHIEGTIHLEGDLRYLHGIVHPPSLDPADISLHSLESVQRVGWSQNRMQGVVGGLGEEMGSLWSTVWTNRLYL